MTVIPNSSDISRVTSQGYVPSAYVSPFGMTLIFLPMRWNNVSGTTGISRDDITCHPPWKSLKEWQSTRLLKYSNWHLFGINAHSATWTKDCIAVHCHRPCSPYMSHSFHQPYSRLFDCKGRGKPEDTRHRPYSHEKLTAELPQITDLGILWIFNVNCQAFFLWKAYSLLHKANKKAIGMTGYSMTKKRSHGHNDTWTNKRQGNRGTR